MSDLVDAGGATALHDPGVIECLERALDQARAGELRSVAIAVVHRDYGMQALFHFGAAPSGMLFGSVERMRHKLHQELDE
ncbi:hypothetical protein DAH66_12710 [Sphingomonas koreensis]|uniref:Uncharacterized protein n=1 Tax=Sphingomonas koreensis TaxID=93064 RepID=A0A430G2C8_9SPHN|nr:hypothetical protein [Sphingomonas koreensis]RSY83124.1 hypothetical protein DAH66_12710 [Sphingomonas koreensis]